MLASVLMSNSQETTPSSASHPLLQKGCKTSDALKVKKIKKKI